MGIDFSKFAKDIQAKIKAALSDDNKISAAEIRAMNLEKETAIELMKLLSGNPEIVGDGFYQLKSKNKSLLSLDRLKNDSIVPLNDKSIEHYKKQYQNDDIKNGYYKDGKMYLVDSKGNFIKDRFNNYITESIDFEENDIERLPKTLDFKANLGLDINSEDGKKVLERMSYLPEEALELIKDGKELAEVLLSSDLPSNFDNISNALELMYGVTLRNEEEFQASKPQREKIIQQIQTVGIMSELYARVAEFNDNYTDNQGLFGMGAEGIGWLLNKVGLNGENHYQWADSCREFIEKINNFKVLNPSKFEQEFKELTGKDKLNVDALQKMVELSKSGKAQDEYGDYTEEFKQAVKDFSNFDVSNPNSKAWYHPDNLLNGFGEALIMIASLGWGAETKAGQMLATSTMTTFSRAGVAIASNQVNSRLLQGGVEIKW